MSPPIRLTDDQLGVIYSAAAPLHRADRDAFLRNVAERLRGIEIGDGSIARACRDAQRQFISPPALNHGNNSIYPGWNPDDRRKRTAR